MGNNTFQTEKQRDYTRKIRAVLTELPMFCSGFFRSMENQTSVLTRYAYAHDLKGFFKYLVAQPELFAEKTIPSLSAADLEKVKACHIEAYLEQMSLYETEDGRELANGEKAKARKLCAVRSLFKYLFKQEMLPSNVAALVDLPKLHEKAIIRLEPNEVANLLDAAEQGEGLSKRQRQYHEATKVRDVAILTLFLGTGIRISELVGIDTGDVDFEDNSFVVTRKGGAQAILAFSDEVGEALLHYYDLRMREIPAEGHEKAMFLSLQKKRINARTVELLVKKYTAVAVPLKKITPHKLRSTYGTMLYHETQDIYLVADVLGHKDVNTTRKHYAAASENNKRKAAKTIKLRED